MTSRSPRASWRRALLLDLRTLRQITLYLWQVWNVKGQIYAPAQGEAGGNSWVMRRRRVDEFPENRAEAWREVETMARALARLAIEIADGARDNALEIEQGEEP
jgi:hypothetical protein